MKKRIGLGLLALALAVPRLIMAEGGQAKQGAGLAPLRLGHRNSTAHLPAFFAQEEGFFREEGLDAELTQFASASEPAAGLESGKLDGRIRLP
jgi:NitT/TauT family transport system substrate-binding protein